MLIDNAAGDYTTDTIYDDANPDQIESLPDTQFHRNVDLALIKADKEGAITFLFGPNLSFLAYIYHCQAMSRFTSSYPLRSMGSPGVSWLTPASRTLTRSKFRGLLKFHRTEVELLWWGQAKMFGQM